MEGLKGYKVVDIGDLSEKSTKGIVTMTKDEWIKRGQELFGPDMMKWRFTCPSCGHIQAVEDFKPYKSSGASPEDAYFNCIGRFDGQHGDVVMCSGKSPCNYTSGGLFCIAPVKVIDGDKEHYAFAFDETEHAKVKQGG